MRQPEALATAIHSLTDDAVVAAVLTTIVAALASFFASYLAKRGEHRANKEMFSDLLEQSKATARETEGIKQFLASDIWRAQQSWAGRERFYSLLMSHLYRAMTSFELLERFHFSDPSSAYGRDDQRGEGFTKLMEEAGEALAETRKLIGPAAIYVSSKTIEALEALIDGHLGLADSAPCSRDYVLESAKLSEEVYRAVLRQARAELKIPT